MSRSAKKLLISATLATVLASASTAENIIILIPDGCGTSHLALARWFKGAPLAHDALTPGLCKTYSANSVITGSAAASTAFATGYKTWEHDGQPKCLAILPDSVVLPEPKKLPDHLQWRPVATVLEAARLKGMSTGLVATSRIGHATPAGYSSHWHDRDNDNVITEQQVYQNIDVVFGGGMRHLLPSTIPGGKRTDGENLVDVLLSRGYSVIFTRSALLSLPWFTRKVWGLFNMSHMNADINRQYFAPEEPSLAEMTEKAISILSHNPKGFFLMVEGSQVDWASHNNDAVGTVTEFMAFDAAVQKVVDFAKTNRNTTVLVFSDHDNGGLSIGKRGDAYTDIQPDKLLPVLKTARITAFGLLDSLIRAHKRYPVDFTFAAAAIEDFFGIRDLTPEDENDINTLLVSVGKGSMGDADVANIGKIVDRRSDIAWTTYGHTGNDVWIYGSNVTFNGTLDNTDIADLCFKKIGVCKQAINAALFQEATELFSQIRKAVVVLDTVGAASGKGSVTVSAAGKTAIFPFYKNEMNIVGGETVQMDGLTVFSQKSGKAYLPVQALRLFRKN